MDKPITFSEWLGTQGNMVLLHANCCRIAYEAGQQSQQAKVEELKASHHGEVIGHEVHFKKIKQERDELQTLYTQQGINMLKLQKRVQFLEQELGAWKGKSIAAMINGMCKQCGKEPWQAIVSDKDGYALLHCFGCGANKYELVGEQALNGDQYDEHRKKAEEAISKGASLTNHRIEL
ncbi:hypothetical protein [Acinetobacter seifertii]|uniref:hypothetical protein n=1 Tax=Acinetobacter seifertii TaxID=1530123 RepID=UPI00124FBA20|nr:hypothetical protein [Acinetobacter seifertii]